MAKPGNADPHTGRQAGDLGPEALDHADDFVSGYKW